VIKPVDTLEELQDIADDDARKQKIEELKQKGLVFVDPAKEANLRVIIDSLIQEKLEVLKQCHILFVCSSEKKHFKEINDLVKYHSVLTVSDVDGFLKTGGIINFVLEQSKIRFEVNMFAADESKLDIRSQLLRLAKEVYKEDPAKGK